MTQQVLDVALFRQQFPEFANDTTYPDAMIQMYWDIATEYVYSWDNCVISGTKLNYSISLMTAHLMRLYVSGSNSTNSGGAAGVVQNATQGSVSVGLVPPPIKDGWYYWLNETPYGQALIALLKTVTALGFYVGGLPERYAFRKVGGFY